MHQARLAPDSGQRRIFGTMTEREPLHGPGFTLTLYRLCAPLLAPFALMRARRRMIAEGIPAERVAERRGIATRARPNGPLVWFHAASIGESLSILPLVEVLSSETGILVTSGTATSATLLAKRLPEGAVHQFVPLDTPAAARRFLDHWRPDAGVFVESEIWPNLIESAGDRGIPLMLINARLSERTLARWSKMPRAARAVFSRFRNIVTQDQGTLDGLRILLPGATTRLTLGGNMKAAATPLPVDETSLAHWCATLGLRKTWIASSTHEGEDIPVLDAHDHVRKAHPDALLILVPRHPHRGPDIAREARALGHETARLAEEEPVRKTTSVLVADTLGELGLWYRLSSIVFLAGSFGEAGGHNPWEPVALGAILLHGPKVRNAANDYRDLKAQGAAHEVADADALGEEVSRLLSNPEERADRQEAARAASGGADTLVAEIATEIGALLETRGDPK